MALVERAGDAAVAWRLAMPAAADRHLLLGLLALQNGVINQAQLVQAIQAWTYDKSRNLADQLERGGDLTAVKRALGGACGDSPGSTWRRRRKEPGRGVDRQVDAGEHCADWRPRCRRHALTLEPRPGRPGRPGPLRHLFRRHGHERRAAVPRPSTTRAGRTRCRLRGPRPRAAP